MSPVSGIIFTINGTDYMLQQAAIVWFGLVVVLSLFFFYCSKVIKKADYRVAPKGLMLILVQLYNLVLFVIQGNLRKSTNKFLPLFGSLIVMMALSNLIGLVGLQPPTSNIGVNATIAVCLWLLIQGKAIKDHGVIGRLKELMDPHWLLFPLNLIGELVIPLSLSMRLFGNILSGAIIMGMVYGLFAIMNQVFVMMGFSIYLLAPFLHMYFDIFSGLIQTYVFFTIASFFLGQAGDND